MEAGSRAGRRNRKVSKVRHNGTYQLTIEITGKSETSPVGAGERAGGTHNCRI